MGRVGKYVGARAHCSQEMLELAGNFEDFERVLGAGNFSNLSSAHWKYFEPSYTGYGLTW